MWSVLLELLRNDDPSLFWSGGHWRYLCLHSGVCPGLPNAHSPHKSLFLSFLGLRSANCLFLMADLMLLGSVRMSYARDYKLWTLEIAGQQWKIKTLCSQKANCTNKAWTQTPDTRGVFPTEAENIHHWASVLGLTF